LLYGPREKLRVLAREPDFMVLDTRDRAPVRLRKAPLAVAIMGAVLLSVLVGWLPIAIAAVIGATFTVLTRCVSMEEAYRFIDWPVVFLIACMLPLGIAMDSSGAAHFLADRIMDVVGGLGPLGVLAGLFLLSTLASQVMPNPAVVVLMAPVALATAGDLGVSPYSLMMAIAIAASASFLSPVSHPANALVMSPGGYRFSDYVRVGLPLTVVVFLVTLLLLPLIWPF
jgi:di/tricarboxylate transporter